MKFLKNNYLILSVIGLIVLYLITRLANILSLPIFTDEAIYVRWAQIASNDANWRFISLTDGKQPSFIWIGMILMKFVEDPLLAGRLVSVIAGFFSLIGIYLLGSETFKNRIIGLISSLIYVLFPFSLFYDRLALYDSLVALFMIWSLYFEILLIRRNRLDIALILGMIMGGGMLTKTSANFAFLLLPASVLLFEFKSKNWKKNLIKWLGFALVSVVLAQIIYAILRLSPFYHIISAKNQVFVYPFSEWIRSPFGYFVGNIKGLTNWLISYASAPFLILALSTFFIKKYFREKLLLLIWFAVPFGALALFGKVIYPRFILFMSMPILVLGAYALYSFYKISKQTWIKIAIPIIFLFNFIIDDYFIINNYQKVKVPAADQEQFINGWPSGVGVIETVKFIRDKSKDRKIFIGTQGTFGLMPYSLEIYFRGNPNVEIKGYWPISDNIPDEVLRQAEEMPAYFVFYQPCPPCSGVGMAPKSWPLREVFQIKKTEENFYTLYEVKND